MKEILRWRNNCNLYSIKYFPMQKNKIEYKLKCSNIYLCDSINIYKGLNEFFD